MRTYAKDGRTYLPVTSVLPRYPFPADPAAMQRGTDVHRLIAISLHGRRAEPPDELLGYYQAWLDWTVATKTRLSRVEVPVFSDRYGYAGTPDAVGSTVDGKPVVVDWKTESVMETCRYQLAAYGNALMESGEITRVPERWAVILKRDGSYGMRIYHAATFYQDMLQFVIYLRAANVRQEVMDQEGPTLIARGETNGNY